MIYDDTKLYQGNRVCKYDCDSFSVYDSPNAEPLARLETRIKGKFLPGSVRTIKINPELNL